MLEKINLVRLIMISCGLESDCLLMKANNQVDVAAIRFVGERLIRGFQTELQGCLAVMCLHQILFVKAVDVVTRGILQN